MAELDRKNRERAEANEKILRGEDGPRGRDNPEWVALHEKVRQMMKPHQEVAMTSDEKDDDLTVWQVKVSRSKISRPIRAAERQQPPKQANLLISNKKSEVNGTHPIEGEWEPIKM